MKIIIPNTPVQVLHDIAQTTETIKDRANLEIIIWDVQHKPIIDMFDELKPDIVMIHESQLDHAFAIVCQEFEFKYVVVAANPLPEWPKAPSAIITEPSLVKNFPRLPESVSSRLTLENDDKASMYSVKDLYYGIYKQCGVPIVFDYHHHRFCDGGLSEKEALEMAISTWPKDITPVVHYSESRSKERLDESIRPQAHSDYVYDYIDTYGNDVDIMIEAKHKELAVLKYLELHGHLDGLS